MDHPFEGGLLLLAFADRSVHEVGHLTARPGVHEPDEIAEQRRIRPLAALVCRDARKLEQLVDLARREVQLGWVCTGRRSEPVTGICEPVVHGGSLVSRKDAGSPRIERDTWATEDAAWCGFAAGRTVADPGGGALSIRSA
jgi:3'-phosphoadenosine 5'-phosphosulfate sulfotransferase (PAPS reductase)/FAD synthetase